MAAADHIYGQQMTLLVAGLNTRDYGHTQTRVLGPA